MGPGAEPPDHGRELLEATTGAALDEHAVVRLAAEPLRRFLVWQHLGTTNWSSVYVALDLALDRHVVLKISRAAAESEPRLLAALAHPNVVVVHGVEEIQGHPCTIMEWCPEGDLGSYARLYPVHQLLARCVEIGHALTHLHANDIVHGDVKPTNILIQDGRAKLGDFGLARRSTNSGEVAGTAPFIPPERFAGVWRPAGDVFSLSFTIYHCVELCRNVPPSVYASVKTVLERGCTPVPEQRPSMLELTRMLDDIVREPERVRQQRNKWRNHAIAVLALITALFSGVFATTFCIPRPEEPSIELAIEYAEKGDPITAWSYFRQSDEQAMVTPDDALTLAETLLESTETLPAEDRKEAAFIAGRIARRASVLAKESGDQALRERAREALARSRALVTPHN
ncbi:MAG: serine/threonine protein kinase [Deltaproteobacteria bacterium]|nr:serine/threonine protein kinase [Deltaproteobacteria bacterium]